MQDLTPDEKVMLQLERRMAQDSQTRAVRDRLFRNSPQLATIGADGRIQALGGDDAPAEFMPNLYYGQGEIVDYTPVQGGLGKADRKSFIGATAIASTPLPVFPDGSATRLFFSDDRLFVQLDGQEQNLNFTGELLGSNGYNYFIDNNNPSIISHPFGESEYQGIVANFPSGDLRGYIFNTSIMPYTRWKVDVNCLDGYALTPSCDFIQLSGLAIIPDETYELQGIVNFNGGGFVDFHPLASAIAADNGLNIGIGEVLFDKPLNTINTIGEGDSTFSCAAIGLTTVEWTWKWRKQGLDWFEL